jgi:hypothetical protein
MVSQVIDLISLIDMSEQSYLNSYRLLIGETTYEELSAKGSFLLPKNHEDPQVTLDYYISVEDYEKCIKIRDKMKEDEL